MQRCIIIIIAIINAKYFIICISADREVLEELLAESSFFSEYFHVHKIYKLY